MLRGLFGAAAPGREGATAIIQQADVQGDLSSGRIATWSRLSACRDLEQPGIAALRAHRRTRGASLSRPIEGDWPYDLHRRRHAKVRRMGVIIALAVIRPSASTPTAAATCTARRTWTLRRRRPSGPMFAASSPGGGLRDVKRGLIIKTRTLAPRPRSPDLHQTTGAALSRAFHADAMAHGGRSVADGLVLHRRALARIAPRRRGFMAAGPRTSFGRSQHEAARCR